MTLRVERRLRQHQRPESGSNLAGLEQGPGFEAPSATQQQQPRQVQDGRATDGVPEPPLPAAAAPTAADAVAGCCGTGGPTTGPVWLQVRRLLHPSGHTETQVAAPMLRDPGAAGAGAGGVEQDEAVWTTMPQVGDGCLASCGTHDWKRHRAVGPAHMRAGAKPQKFCTGVLFYSVRFEVARRLGGGHIAHLLHYHMTVMLCTMPPCIPTLGAQAWLPDHCSLADLG